jgi:crotonobetaine/carnitine-CoA ligase
MGHPGYRPLALLNQYHDEPHAMPHIDPHITIGALLRERARLDPAHVFCRWEGRSITYAQLDREVDRLCAWLGRAGIARPSRVAVMLPHHPEHIVVLLALMRMGVVAVPVNPQLRGAGLDYILQQSEPAAIICDGCYAEQLLPALSYPAAPRTIWRGGVPAAAPAGATALPRVLDDRTPARDAPDRPDGEAADPVMADDVVAICYTSGTTGPPKGVLITDKMCRCAATSSLLISGIEDGDVPFFWEPMYHLFGIEVVILALIKPVTLAMFERFSASHFWEWARQGGATHIHYVGGVLQLLLKQPPSGHDRTHRVRTAWGGGCPAEIWTEFEERFGVAVCDSFGMTETSALNIINTVGVPGALGRPLPYFDARVVDDGGVEVGPNALGQLLIRGREPGLTTPGYFRNEAATRQALHDGWVCTGDLVKVDEQGLFHFFSRAKDCVRRRGENVSAWEVERIVNQHPAVEESALVAVLNEFGDEDLKIFIKRLPGASVDLAELMQWCAARMARFQVPRFVAFIDAFPKTSTQRIQKQELDRSTARCWDADHPDRHAAPHPERHTERG